MEKKRRRSGDELERLERLEGCLMWVLGVPIVLIIMGALLAVVWKWGTTGVAADSLKWGASVVIVVGVGWMLWAVMRTRRKR